MSDSLAMLENASYTWTEDSVRRIITASSLAKSTFYYVQEIGYFKTFYPYFTERKNLNSFLILYTISGRGFLQYRGEESVLTANTCILLDCMEHHKYSVDQDETWEFLWVHFNGSNARGYYDLFLKEGICLSTLKNSDLFRTSFETLFSIWEARNKTTEILASNLLTELLTTLLLQNGSATEEERYIPEYIQKIGKEIEQRFREELSLSYFEKKYNRNRFAIEKEFKKYMGIPVTESVILARISHAKELLKYSDATICEITFEIGMNHVSHFINLFKAREHMTPLSYRREWRNE